MVSLSVAMELLSSFAIHLKKVDLDSFDRVFHDDLLPLATKIVEFRSDHLSASGTATEYSNFIAGCIPIWEALHFHASLLGPLRSNPQHQSLILQLITYVCHDPTQRRCFYQSPLLHGDAAELPGLIHLATPTSFRTAQQLSVTLPEEILSVPKTLWEFTVTFSDSFRWEGAAARLALGARYKQLAAGTWANVSQWMTQLCVVTFEAYSRSTGQQAICTAQDLPPSKASFNSGTVVILSSTFLSSSSLPKEYVRIDEGTSSALGVPTTNELRSALIIFSAICFKRPDTAEYGHSVIRALEDTAWLAREVFTSPQPPLTATATPPEPTSPKAPLSYAAIFGDLPNLIRVGPVLRLLPTSTDLPPPRRAALTEWLKLVRRQQLVQQRNRECSNDDSKSHSAPCASDETAGGSTKHSTHCADEAVESEEPKRSTGPPSPDDPIPFAVRSAAALVERTLADVVAEARFSEDGTAQSLRDPDAWIRHLRSCAQLPNSFQSSHITRLLFDRRKRSRDASRPLPVGQPQYDGEGRALLPRIQTLHDAFHTVNKESSSTQPIENCFTSHLTVQERIILGLH